MRVCVSVCVCVCVCVCCIQSLAVLPSTYFYVNFGISHKKMLDGNVKMRINSKHVHKKLMCSFEADSVLSNKKICT